MPLPNRPKAPLKRGKGPTAATPEQIRARSRGALLGLAVGDALGTTMEFKKLVAPMFPELATGLHTEMKGGGPFSVKPGQVTDDTQMAVCLSTSLRNLKRFDGYEVGKEYARWLPHAFDVGNQTKESLNHILNGYSPEFAGRQVWLDRSQKPQGNGSLMRTAPIGVYFAKNQAARITASMQDSAITHFAPICQLVCVAFNAVIAGAILSPKEKFERDDVLRVIEADLSLAAAELGRTHPEFVLQIQDGARFLREDLAAAQLDDPQLYGPELHLLAFQGWVRVAFRLAFWELFHAPSLEAALIDVVNRGGDADTNGAIVGALLGSVYGESALPERWTTPVLEALSMPGTSPFWTAYHPRLMLELADHLP